MYTKHILKNGTRVIMSKLPGYRSVALGVWVKVGSIDETPENNGLAHFIEHMLFKGTKNYSAKDIAESFDSIGGDLNAFTSKECTCFHAKVLDQHIEVPIRIIGEMLQSPILSEEDIEKEKTVVYDEIMMADDTPDDVSYDLLAKALFQDGSLSRPILGSLETVKSFDKAMIQLHMNQYYTSDNTVIAIAGSFNEAEIISLLEAHFNHENEISLKHEQPNKVHHDFNYIHKDIEQVHLEIGFQGISYGDERVYELAALNNILGASVSSRLFQNIREKYGLTYSINSYVSQYETTGIFAIYASMHLENLNHVATLIRAELSSLIQHGITAEELTRVKEQLKGNYILDLEGTESYMNLLGKSELFCKKIKSPEAVEASINQISLESVNELIGSLLNEMPAISLVGRVNEKHLKTCIDILGGFDEANSKNH